MYNRVLALKVRDLWVTVCAIALQFWDWADWAKGTVIARDILYPILDFIKTWLYARAVDLWNLYIEVWYAEDFFRALGTGTWVDQVISLAFPSWVQFRTNPAAWISGYIQQIVAGLGTILTDPWGWLVSLLTPHISGFSILVANAQTWVLDRVQAAWPAFYNLRLDPATTVWGWIQDRIPDLGQLGVDPLGWLRTNLGLLLGVPDSFFVDPFGYIFQAWLSRFEEGRQADLQWLRTQGEHILRYLVEGSW